METTVTVKGQIVIPAPLRHKFGIQRGTKIRVYEQAGKIVLEPVDLDKLLSSLEGSFKGAGAFEEFLAERSREREL